MDNNKKLERLALERLRKICQALPEAVETTTYGHPTFQAGRKRTFVVLDDHERENMLCVVFKTDLREQARLVDDRGFFPSKFGAKYGWTAARIDMHTDWSLIQKLVLASYRRVALARMIRALDSAAS